LAKRFIDGSVWDKDWFLDLPTKYKVLWFYILTKCDTAGIFDPNLKTVSKLLNEKYIEDECLDVFNNKVIKVLDKWFIIKFIDFQYGDVISEKMVLPINKCLNKIGYSIDTVSILYSKSIDTPIEIEKEKEIENIKEKRVLKLKFLDFVYLTSDERDMLCERLGVDVFNKMVCNLNDYIGSKGTKYKSHYHTILSWINKNGIPSNQAKKGTPRIENPLETINGWEKQKEEENARTLRQQTI
jgi:hypothetical protein